jgi:hypothetical protein
MRVSALLALLFGTVQQGLLDGQVFTHAVFGIACGIAALFCGLSSARKNHSHRWEGRIMAGLGLALGIWCVAMLPSSYRFQQKFNSRREQKERIEEKNSKTNKNASGHLSLQINCSTTFALCALSSPSS